MHGFDVSPCPQLPDAGLEFGESCRGLAPRSVTRTCLDVHCTWILMRVRVSEETVRTVRGDKGIDPALRMSIYLCLRKPFGGGSLPL